MNFANFLEGANILLPYYNNSHGYHLGADHDVIYMYATDRPVSPDDLQKLYDLGFFQSDAETDADDKPIYDPEVSWWAYV